MQLPQRSELTLPAVKARGAVFGRHPSPFVAFAHANADDIVPARDRGGAGAEPSGLAAIFAALRDGETPWTTDELPADTGAADVLLTEIDRLWDNPPAQ